MSKESPKTMEREMHNAAITPDKRTMKRRLREMRKRIIAGSIITFMLLSLMPQSALAATHTLTDGQMLNLATGVLTRADDSTETLTISGGDTISVAENAAVTITGSKNVKISCGSGVTLKTYTHFPYQTAVNGQLYGVNLPDGWSGAGIYAVAKRLTYDDNGGTGGKTVFMPAGLTAIVDNSDGVSNTGYTFMEWNTKANGTGTSYQAGDSIVMDSDITLYAIWEAVAPPHGRQRNAKRKQRSAKRRYCN